MPTVDSKRPTPRLDAPGIVVLAFFSVFGFIGIAVLVFVWSPTDPFHTPPLFFRVFASFIACAFMLLGFGLPLSAIVRARRHGGSIAGHDPASSGPAAPSSGAGYACPNCGAGLGQGQEVSPGGDAKCGYCHRWWNILRR